LTRTSALAAVLLRSAGEPALRRALPLYVGIGMSAAVLFGPTGMSAADVTDPASASRGFRLALWAAWLAAIAGPARVLFSAPQSLYLRAFPVSPAWHQLLLGCALAALEAPWAWLFLRGQGVVEAGAALALGVALAALLAARARGFADWAIGAAVAAGAVLVIALPAPAWARLAYGLVGSLLAVPAAWWRAPEAGAGWRGVRVRGTAFTALVRAHAAALWRLRRPAFGRALIATLLGGGFAGLAARANEVGAGASLAVMSLAIGAVTLSMAAGSFAVPVIESERSSRWILDASAASGVRRAAASSAVVAGLAAGCGLIHGSVVAWAAGAYLPDALRLGAEGAGAGAALGLVALWVARAAERSVGVDGVRVVAYLTAVAAVCAIGFGVAGEIGLALLVGLALALSIRTADQAAFPARRWAGRSRRGA